MSLSVPWAGFALRVRTLLLPIQISPTPALFCPTVIVSEVSEPSSSPESAARNPFWLESVPDSPTVIVAVQSESSSCTAVVAAPAVDDTV